MKKTILLLFMASMLMLSCADEHGIAPVPGRLDLDVKFLNPDIPEDTEGIYVFVAPQFPPHAINEMFLSPNSLPLTGESTIPTSIDLPYGHYEAIGLWWYNKNTESNLADVFTLKIGKGLLPYTFDITKDEPVHETDLWADLNRVERDASLQGTITFKNGNFPSNTLATAIGAYSIRPESAVDYLVFLLSMDISIDENPYHFNLPVKGEGIISYLAVFWLSDQSGLDSFQTLGYYQDPDNPGQPMMITLEPNKQVTGIEIEADWNNIKN